MWTATDSELSVAAACTVKTRDDLWHMTRAASTVALICAITLLLSVAIYCCLVLEQHCYGTWLVEYLTSSEPDINDC